MAQGRSYTAQTKPRSLLPANLSQLSGPGEPKVFLPEQDPTRLGSLACCLQASLPSILWKRPSGQFSTTQFLQSCSPFSPGLPQGPIQAPVARNEPPIKGTGWWPQGPPHMALLGLCLRAVHSPLGSRGLISETALREEVCCCWELTFVCLWEGGPNPRRQNLSWHWDPEAVGWAHRAGVGPGYLHSTSFLGIRKQSGSEIAQTNLGSSRHPSQHLTLL